DVEVESAVHEFELLHSPVEQPLQLAEQNRQGDLPHWNVERRQAEFAREGTAARRFDINDPVRNIFVRVKIVRQRDSRKIGKLRWNNLRSADIPVRSNIGAGRSLVAQISNLCTPKAFGAGRRASSLLGLGMSRRVQKVVGMPIGNRRYSRLEICATLPGAPKQLPANLGELQIRLTRNYIISQLDNRQLRHWPFPFGICFLGFVWNLGFGVWDFLIAHLRSAKNDRYLRTHGLDRRHDFG